MINRKGSILIVSLWVTATLSIAVLSLTSFTQGRMRVLDRRLGAAESAVAFLTGSRHVSGLYALENQAGETDPGKRWLGLVAVPEELRDLRISSQDEVSKLNINLCSKETLLKLLEELRKEKNTSFAPSLLARTILNLRAKKSIEYLEEIRNPARLTDTDLETLYDYLTVYGNGKVNANTAPEPVLRALIRNQAVLEAILSKKRQKKYFRSADMEIAPFLSELDLGATPEMNVAASETLALLTTRSNILRIEMLYRGKFHGMAVVDLASGPAGQKNRILFWHEKILATRAF